MKILVVVLILIGVANAQISLAACNAPTVTVSDYDSSASLASQCTSLSGSLEISNSTAEDIILDGLEKIVGDLICVGAKTDGFTSISSSTLNGIFGEIKLESATSLSSIDFGKLESIGGLDIVSNVALQSLSFPALMYSRGPMIMSGNFSSVLILQLKVVNGTFQLLSATDTDCSAFDVDNEAGVFPVGEYVCMGHNATSSTTSFGTSTTITVVQKTKRPSLPIPSAPPSMTFSSIIPFTTSSVIQPANTSSSSIVPATATSDTGPSIKKNLAIGLGTGLAILSIIIASFFFWWMMRASHKKHKDKVSRVPVLLTGNMLLDNVPERERDKGQSRFGDPRHSGLSYHEVHTELEEFHGLEKSRPLTGLEKERVRWLMEHMFLRAEPEPKSLETVERVEMKG